MKQFKCTKCGFQFPYADDATEIQCPNCSMKYGKSKPKLPEPVVATISDSLNNSTDEKKVVQPQPLARDYEAEHRLNQGRVLCSSAMKAYGMTELITGILTVAFAIGLFSNLLGLIALAAMGWVRYYVIGVGILLIVVGASNIGVSHRIMFASPEVIKNNEITGSAIIFLLLFFTVSGIPCAIANIIEGRRYDTGLRIMGNIEDSSDFDDSPLDNSARKKLGKVVGTVLAVIGVGFVVLLIIAVVAEKLSTNKKENSFNTVAGTFKTVTPALDTRESTKNNKSDTEKLASEYWDAVIEDTLNGTDTANDKWDEYWDASMQDYYKSLANQLLNTYPKCLNLPEDTAYTVVSTYPVKDFIGDVRVYYVVLAYKDTRVDLDYVLRDKNGKVIGDGSSAEVLYFGCAKIISIYISKEEYSKLSDVDWNITTSDSLSSYYTKEDYANCIEVTEYNSNDGELYLTATVPDAQGEKVKGNILVVFANQNTIVDVEEVYYSEKPNNNKIVFSCSDSYNDYDNLLIYYDYADFTVSSGYTLLK